MTDVLKPEVLWIEGRRYRINDPSTEMTSLNEHDLYEDDNTYRQIFDEGDEDDDFEVVMVDNSRYKTNLHVPKHYLGSIIGKKGSIKSRIERETRTDIKIPRHGQEGDVTILGPTEANVKAARKRINMTVISSRMKQRPTHFISIPTNSPEIVKRFEEFKVAVLRECSESRGLNESIFISGQKLHITVGVMCLMDNTERLLASKLLTEANEKIVTPLLRGHLPLYIRIKGLSYMNDDPTQINVLYANVEEEGTDKGLIQQLADGLADHFRKAGLMEREFGRDDVKLHVTLLNSKYRNRTENMDLEGSTVSGNSRQPRETFDGSQVLKMFAGYDFGLMELNDIHLSQRHAIGPDGYYQPTFVASILK